MMCMRGLAFLCHLDNSCYVKSVWGSQALTRYQLGVTVIFLDRFVTIPVECFRSVLRPDLIGAFLF